MTGKNETFESMKSACRWVVSNPSNKIPLSPDPECLNKLSRASSTDSCSWGSYDSAVATIERMDALNEGRGGKADRYVLGFVLGDGWCGIDLDHVCPARDKRIDSIEAKEARAIVAVSDGVSYSEWSPSGDGIHCIFETEKPEGYVCKKKLDLNSNGLPQVAEFYGAGRFFTVTLDELQPEEGFIDNRSESALDSVTQIGDVYFKRGRPFRDSTPGNVKTVWGSSPVEKYVSTIIQNTKSSAGTRNSDMFSIAGNIAKKVDYNPNTTLEHCKAVNHACFAPPLDDFELVNVVQSSLKNGTPRVDTPYVSPYQVEEFAPDPTSLDKLNNLSNDLFKSQLNIEDLESIPGFIGEYIKLVKTLQVGYQPALAVAGAFSCMSALVGGRIECEGTVPSIMAVGLAPSGGGKDFSRQLTADVLSKSDNGKRSGPEHLSSGEGLVAALAGRGPQLFQLDEAAELFAEVGRSANPIAQRTAKFLKEAYSKAGRKWQPNARADAGNNIEVEYPYATIYFTTTSQRWWGSFPDEGVADGLLGRCLIFEAEGYAEPSRKPYRPARTTQRLADFAAAWVQESKMIDEALNTHCPDQWELTPEASKVVCDFMFKTEAIAHRDEQGGTERDAIWMRSRDRICKVALLIAASQKGPNGDCKVEQWHMELAIDIVKATNYRVLHRLDTCLASNEEQKTKLKVLKVLEKHGPLKKGDLYRKGVRCEARMRDQALKTLVEEGEIEQRTDGLFKRVAGKPQAI